ncbi:retrotransposon protein, putative, ty1-copia subclass [Tanacetum coccineum]
MYTYLKNMEGYKLNDLKLKDFDSIQKMFDRAFKRGNLKTMFEPHVEDAIWMNQQGYKVLEWKLYDSCGVHSLMMQHGHIYMLVEKKYPLAPLTLSMMLEKKLKIDYESEMVSQLLKFIIKQLKKSENKLAHLEQPLIPLPYHVASQAACDVYDALFDAQNEMFEEQAKQELFEIIKAFHACKHEDGKSVSSFLLKIKSYLDTLEHLGYAMPNELGTIAELHVMVKLYKKGIPKKAETPAVLAIREGRIHKDKKKPKGEKDENQLGKKIKAIQSERGGEYLSHEFVNHMKSCGVVSQLTPPYTPQHNGGYAIESASRIVNMVPTKKVNRTSYKIWHGKAPKISYLEVWGCEVLVKQDTPKKLDSRSIKYIFVGYPKEMIGYYFYYPLENKIFITRNAEFFENSVTLQEASRSHGLLEASESDVGLELIHEDDTQPSEDTIKRHDEVEPNKHELGDLNEPPNYKAALLDPESNKWLDVMNTEMQSMKDNQVWTLVDLPPNVDYGETFSPVSNTRAIRILLAIVAFYHYEIWQMDVKTTFLNGHLSEDVYVVQPKGFVDPKHPSKVCKLQCSIYGLKKASKSLNKRFDMKIKKIGFTQNPDEPCVYLKISRSNVAFLVLYIDDILIMGNNVTMPQDVKSWLCAQTPSEVKRIQNVAFASAIGSIMYAVRCTRPDVAFAQNLCSRFQQNPGEIHWTAVKTILKYLRNTKDMVLVYGAKPETELKVTCYADVGFQTDKDDTKSQSGCSCLMYIVAAEASMEDVWMMKFIDGLGDVMPSNKRPMKMLCDNAPAIAVTNDPKIIKGVRHYQRKYHYIREVIQAGEIVLKKVHTDDNLAGPFTKPMPYIKHFEHAMRIGVCPASSLM